VHITLGQGLYPGPASTDTVPIRQMSAGGTDRLAYGIYRDPGLTQSWGNTQASGATLTGDGSAETAMIYASIPSGQSVMSGTYQDTILATITY
jgi:spore coat protein U-like protein